MAVELCLLNGNRTFDDVYEQRLERDFIIKKIFTYSNDAIAVLDKKKHIIICSKKFQEWLSNEDILGESFIKLMNRIVQLPDDFFSERSYFLKIKNKEIDRVLNAQISKHFDNSGKIDKYIVIMKDVTEQNEMQAQKDNFIATLTHDLKTPVRADILALELLLNGKFGDLNQKQKEILEEMLNSNKFLLNMLDTLLAKYKYESDEVVLNKNIFDLNMLVESSAKELKYLFEEKNINLKLNLSDEKIELNADMIELKRALVNLISNAIKFNKENGSVIITTSINDNKAIIKIADTGIGMSKEKMAHIFDRYVSYAKRFRRLGTGLGLFVAKKIIEAHKGTIEVASIPKEGSVFTIKIPILN